MSYIYEYVYKDIVKKNNFRFISILEEFAGLR